VRFCACFLTRAARRFSRSNMLVLAIADTFPDACGWSLE
jgi:hypothetical protein